MKKWYAVFQILAVVIMVHSVIAAEAPQNLSIVRGNGFWPPYEWTEEGILKGFHIDLVKEVAAKLQLNVQFQSVPWKRAINMIQKGEADAITYLARTEEREKFANYFEGNQLHQARVGFFSLKEREQDIKYTGKLEQLKNFKICTLLGQTYGTEFEQATYLKIDKTKTEEVVLKKLIKGRCEVALGYIDDYKIAIQKKGIDKDFVNFTPYVSEHPMYFAFSKARKLEALAKRFAEAMELFKTTPRYQELLKKYDISEN